MPRSSNQKLKTLYLAQILLRQTDEAHPMTVNEMITALAARDIRAERKSIYDDIEALRTFGLDIVQTRSKTTGYYIASRDFELPELKLLVDCVQSSKFITEKKTLSLIRKIENLASVHEARSLQRQVYVHGRVKSMNESVYYNVDEISAAIGEDRAITFRYFEFTMDRQRRFRRDGAFYTVSPYALVWDDENYYLLAFDHLHSEIRHYRVDKITSIAMTDETRLGKEAFLKVDMTSYADRVFSMFTGSEQPVKIRFASHLAGAVIDRFGPDVMIIPQGTEAFTVHVRVAVSPQFFAWVFGLGAEILSPPDVREKMQQMLRTAADAYQK